MGAVGRRGWLSAALAATALCCCRPRPAVTPAPPVRFDLILPPEMRLDDLRRRRDLAGWAAVRVRRPRGWPRAAGPARHGVHRTGRPAGTEGGFGPFWSPDSRSVAFFAPRQAQLKRVPVTGGPARVLADTTCDGSLRSAARGRRRRSCSAPATGRIYRVADTGGTASALETLPWKPGQRRFASPRFLPDGRHFLVTVAGDPALYVASLDAPGTRKILDDGSSAVYAAGHLFYARGAGLFARPFDPERLEFSGAEVQVTERAGDVFRVRRRHDRLPPGRRLGVEADVVRPQRPAHGHAGRAGAVSRRWCCRRAVAAPRSCGSMPRRTVTSGTWISRAASSRG